VARPPVRRQSWAQRTRAWAKRGDAFVYFISGAKEHNPAAAEADVNAELATYTGKPLKASLIAASFKEITFTDDPDESSLTTDASQAVSLGLLKSVNLSGLFDLGPLNQALAAAGQPQVST